MKDNAFEDRIGEVASRLVELGYVELFLRLDEEAIDSIWDIPRVSEVLKALAIDSKAPPLASFLAAEVLFYKLDTYPPESDKRRLAEVYAMALRENFTAMANPWGLPGSLDGDPGMHFIKLGEWAVAPLMSLLDVESEVTYGGSREATFGNRYRYRVKDLAAFYLSRIRDIRYEVVEDPGERDKRIEELKAELER